MLTPFFFHYVPLSVLILSIYNNASCKGRVKLLISFFFSFHGQTCCLPLFLLWVRFICSFLGFTFCLDCFVFFVLILSNLSVFVCTIDYPRVETLGLQKIDTGCYLQDKSCRYETYCFG